MDSSNTNAMTTPRSDSAPSRSGTTSRIPVLPRAGPSGLQDSRRLSLPGMVGKGKGKSLSGTHPVRIAK